MADLDNLAPSDHDADGERPARELTPEELEALELEREFARKLVRIWRRARLYEMEHQTIQDDLDEFMEGAESFFEHVPRLNVLIEAHQIESERFSGEILVEDSKEEGGLCNRLFLDGFRDVAFEQGLTRDELQALIEVWSTNMSSPEYAEDTLATLMWACEFRHITYVAVSGFQDACNFNPGGGAGGVESMLARIQGAVSPFSGGEGPSGMGGGGGGASVALAGMMGGGGNWQQGPGGLRESGGGFPGEIPDEAPPPDGVTRLEKQRYKLTEGLRKERLASIDTITTDGGEDEEVVNVSKEELRALRSERKNETAAEAFSKLANLLITLGMGHPRQMPLDETSPVILESLHKVLEEGDMAPWYRALDYLGYYGQEGKPGFEDQAPRIRKLVRSMVDPEHLGLLLANIDPRLPEEVDRYVATLEAARLDRIEATFGAIECTDKIQARRRACHLLVGFSQDLPWYGKHLFHREPRVVKDMLYCILRIGGEESFPYFVQIYRHPKAEVRREALTLLKHHINDAVERVLLLSIEDKSEENRILGYQQIGWARLKSATRPLVKIVTGEDFWRCSHDEKRAAVMALVAAAGEDAIPTLRKLMETEFSILGRSQRRETQLVAAEALGVINNALTRHILREARHEAHNEVKEAIDRALAHPAATDLTEPAEEGHRGA